jgi:putative PEP-CTERM system TPR-repeat lipoprotein
MPASTLRKSALALALAAVLGTLGCSESVESLVASGEAALGKGDYRTAQIQLKSALQQDLNNARARWLLGELSLTMEDGASAEKEIRRAGELGVGNDAVIPALAQALLLQGKVDEVLDLPQPPELSPRARGEVMAAQGLALLAKGEKGRADELTAEALKLAPDNRFATTARVRVLIDAKKLDEAEQLLTGLQQKFPDYGLSWSLMGDLKDARGDLPKAEEAYTAAMSKRGYALQDQFKRATVRLAQQNVDGALADATQLNKALPNFQPAWFLTGAANFQKKSFPKAQEALDRSYQLTNDHVPTLILLGWTNLSLGNIGQAVEQAGRAVAIAPNLVGPRNLMATLHLRQGQPKQAEDIIRPVVDGLPDYLPAKSLLAASLQAQGKGDQAAPYLEQIAAAKPESLDVQTAVGMDLLRAREPERALAVLEGVIRKTPEAPRANAALVAALLQEKKFNEALAAAERFQQQDPSNISGLRLLAETQLATGDQAKAIASYRRVLELLPGDSAAAVRLAESLTRDNDLVGARKLLEGASQANPNDAGIIAVLSQVALMQGQVDEAKDLLRKAIEKNPDHQMARLLLAERLLAEGDPRGVLAVLPDQTTVTDPRVLATRSQANLQLKDYAKARDDLERLVSIQPQSAALQLQLASAYGALGDVERMHKSLDSAARLAPKDASIGLAHARSLAVRGKVKEAAEALGGLELPGTNVGLLDTQLLIAEKKGDSAEQLRLSEALFNASPSSVTVLRRAQLQAASGQQDAAEQSLRRWFEQNPDDEVVTLALAGIYGRSARPDQAVALLRPLVVKHPENVSLLNNLAWYLKASAPGEALPLAEKAHRLAPENTAVLDTYAVVLAENGKSQQALEIVDRAIAKAADPSYLKLVRIGILARAGNSGKAVEELEAAKAAGLPTALQGKVSELEQLLEVSK